MLPVSWASCQPSSALVTGIADHSGKCCFDMGFLKLWLKHSIKECSIIKFTERSEDLEIGRGAPQSSSCLNSLKLLNILISTKSWPSFTPFTEAIQTIQVSNISLYRRRSSIPARILVNPTQYPAVSLTNLRACATPLPRAEVSLKLTHQRPSFWPSFKVESEIRGLYFYLYQNSFFYLCTSQGSSHHHHTECRVPGSKRKGRKTAPAKSRSIHLVHVIRSTISIY